MVAKYKELKAAGKVELLRGPCDGLVVSWGHGLVSIQVLYGNEQDTRPYLYVRVSATQAAYANNLAREESVS